MNRRPTRSSQMSKRQSSHARRHAVSVAALLAAVLGGAAHAQSNSVVCWGNNANAQSSVPSGLGTVQQIAGGNIHSVALKANGTVVCWGNVAEGQTTVPAGLGIVQAIAAGNFHTIALKSDGTVACWGRNNEGQCNVPAGLSGVIGISGGWKHTVALKSDGTVQVWGNNNSVSQTPPASLSGVTAVASGEQHNAARRSDGTVACWGAGTINSGFFPNYGQSAPPAGLSSVTKIAAGRNHTVAMRSNGTVVCWGQNSNGQINVPAGLSGVVGIAAGQNHTLALRSNGTVVGWGLNTNGQLNTPASIGFVTDLAGGGTHTMAEVAAAPTAVLVSSTPATCNASNGAIDVTVANASSVSWSGPGGFTSSSTDLSGLVAGSYTLTATGLGGVATLNVSVSLVPDTAPPVVTSYNASPSVDVGVDCTALVPDLTGSVVATDNCTPAGSLAIEQSPAAGTSVGIGSATITLTVRDALGNEAVVTSSLSVNGHSTVCYHDADGDSFGNPTTATAYCVAPEGWVLNGDDCDDNDATIHPDADEDCDERDDDCDGLIDEDLPTYTYYPDADADGFGDGRTYIVSCSPVAPEGYVAVNGDCNDADAAVYPGAVETCADLEIDNDCDEDTSEEEASDRTAFFADADADGFSGSNTALFCTQPEGYAATDEGDCNDADALVYPGAGETCADLATDNDCDGDTSEEEAGDRTTFYADADSDGFSGSDTALFCTQPEGYAATDEGDCNDADASVNPGAAELCADLAIDNDCDGDTSEEEASDRTAFYADADADGFSGSNTALFCMQPEGYAATDEGDCDDADALVYPGAAESCADLAIDNDCDGDMSDAEASDTTDYFVDADQDGFGAGAATPSCSPIEGSVTNADDCDDADGATYPGAAELCANLGTDNDCDGVNTEEEASDRSTFYQDADGDGFTASTTGLFCSAPAGYEATDEGDCNDADVAVFPGAPELCTNLGIDNDCDGMNDEEEASDRVTFYADGDGDGFSGSTTGLFCLQPEGFEPTDEGDCDDSNATVYPGATEICDDLDNDCNKAIDDGLLFEAWYPDLDADGFGDERGEPIFSCRPIEGYVPNKRDCDDGNADVNPDAPEVCDALDDDENCDNLADDADPTVLDSTRSDFYADADLDGYGAGAAVRFCDMPAGYAAVDTDCDDADKAINPGAFEICDAADTDENCNGLADDADGTTLDESRSDFYADNDLDGYGAGDATRACEMPAGSSHLNTDCNDADPAINPGATEICDPENDDEDCDGLADDNDPRAADSTKSDFYLDGDLDGFGAGAVVRYCDPAPGRSEFGTDCDDADAAVYPGAAELCADLAVDNDCDGDMSDAEAKDSVDYFVDGDADGFGAGPATPSCSPIEGSVTNSDDCDDAAILYADNDSDGFGAGAMAACGVASNTDCDDANGAINPAATEVCDEIDNNCDMQIDEGVQSTFYADGDSDGFGDPKSSMLACTAPAGFVSDSTDCNDADAAVYPGAPELCADLAVDNDCDGDMSDAEASDRVDYFVDGDADGFGAGDPTPSCSPIEGSVTNGDDCDDAAILYADNDSDGFGAGAMAACGVASNTDCDDANGAINPDATEVCDEVDNNCDMQIDEGVQSTFYADGDSDGFGDPKSSTLACTAPAGFVSDSTDCNDADAAVYPGAPELCADLAVDNDCDGDMSDAEAKDSVDYFVDGDADGFGAGPATPSCSPIEGSVTNSDDCDDAAILYADNDSDGFGAGAMAACGVASNTDCDDANGAINPDATEVCDEVDNNCDMQVDEGVQTTFYADQDGDGYGDAADSVAACTAPEGFVTDGTDCDDANAEINPAATEVCDEVDNNCDAQVDEGVQSTFYADQDGDGAGDPNWSLLACAAPDGFVSEAGDDCPTTPGVFDPMTWYADADGDGAGDAGDTVSACEQPSGYVAVAGDGCPADANKVEPGACGCGAADTDADGNGTADCADFMLTLVPGATSVRDGNTLTVRVRSSFPFASAPDRATGIQFALAYDPTRLAIDAADMSSIRSDFEGGPFPREIYESVDQANGLVLYAAGIETAGPGMVEDSDLVEITFTVLPGVSECDAVGLVGVLPSSGPAVTRVLAEVSGDIDIRVPSLLPMGPVSLDFDGPALAGVPEADILVPTDAGSLYGGFVADPGVTAEDNCDGSTGVSVAITLPDTTTLDAWPSDGMFPIGISTVVWSSIDSAGNTTSDTILVEVGDYQHFNAHIALNGAFAGSSNRSIRVRIEGVDYGVFVVPMTGRLGTISDIVVPVATAYSCADAKDTGHSLSSTASPTIADREYQASFALIQGDSNDDNRVDIYDFSLFVTDRGAGKSPEARSNFDADGDVDNGDFAFLSLSFFGEGVECGGGTLAGGPVTRVSVKELRRQGLGHLAAADLNRDGWVDLRDMQLYMQGFDPDAPQAEDGLGR